MSIKDELRGDIISSIFSTITVFMILFILRLEHTLVITSFAASSYIAFILPSNASAKHRNLTGGHLIRLCFGTLAAIL